MYEIRYECYRTAITFTDREIILLSHPLVLMDLSGRVHVVRSSDINNGIFCIQIS